MRPDGLPVCCAGVPDTKPSLPSPPQPVNGGRLSVATRLGYAMGEHTLSLSFSALSLFYLLFLTEVGGLRPALAGAVLLIGRTIDAFTDPLMGRLSDLTRLPGGRRRPYFLLGALPFGASFALLFVDVPVDSQWARFAYYAALYALWTTASTVLTVPYVALLPELTPDYNERTSLSIYRSASGQLGTMIAALATQPTVRALGGGAYAYLVIGIVYGVWLTWPWLVVFFSTRERPEFQRPVQISFVLGLRLTLRHRAYRRLMALYLCSRVAMDVTGALLVFYFTYWLRRPEDFELAMGALLGAVMLSLPFWLRASRSQDKRAIFIWGTSWWLITMLCFVLATPDWPQMVPAGPRRHRRPRLRRGRPHALVDARGRGGRRRAPHVGAAGGRLCRLLHLPAQARRRQRRGAGGSRARSGGVRARWRSAAGVGAAGDPSAHRRRACRLHRARDLDGVDLSHLAGGPRQDPPGAGDEAPDGVRQAAGGRLRRRWRGRRREAPSPRNAAPRAPC